MGVIEDVYDDLETDVSLEEFREAVESKVEQMGGLADEETAAMLIAHEIDDGEVEGIADVEPGMKEVKFIARVVSVGELRTFDRDNGGAESATPAEDEPPAEATDPEEEAEQEEGDQGAVVNVEVADESGQIRIAFWDEHAHDAVESLEVGDVLRIKGRPQEGYSGVEVNVDEVEPDPDTEIDVRIDDTYRIEDLSLGRSDVNCSGRLLDVNSARTFDRDDGSEGKVANLTIGDPTGRIRVTLWDDMADRVEELAVGTSVEIVDGYVRERDGDLELHVGDRGAVAELDKEIEFVPDRTSIGDLEIGQTVDIAGVVRSADPKRTFDRDDGSEGQVRNVRVQDETGDIRVALWGDKADLDVAPGDEVLFADVEIDDGWQDDLEASANWRSTVTILEDGGGSAGHSTGSDDEADLSTFAQESDDETTHETVSSDGGSAATLARNEDAAADGETVEFTGTVVQAGNPVILDDGEETVTVETGTDVALGEEITVRGEREADVIDATDVF
jgi:replication factor A1